MTTDGTLRTWSAGDRPVEVTSLLTSLGLAAMIERRELVATPSVSSLAGQGRIVYQQYFDGRRVIGGRLVIRKDREGRATSVHSSLAKITGSNIAAFSITNSTARDLAFGAIPTGRDARAVRIEQAALPQPGGVIPVWVVIVRSSAPADLWEVFVDASDGTVISVEDRLLRFDGRGLIFDPDPKSVTGDSALTDRSDSAAAVPQAAYSEVTLSEITQGEDSLYALTGPNVDTSPTANRARSNDGNFLFDREDDRFEEVMAYFHLDRQARYVVSLGFADLPPEPIFINSDGVEDDVSYYDPESGVITTGTGGVDDGEDADVLLHEYTHALIERILPDWRGGDTPLLIEGLCDYFAGDGSLASAPDYHPEDVYNWDGHNEFWAGRVLHADYHYPADAGRERHDAGQLWSGALFEVRRQAGDRDAWNQVVLDHLFSLADSATVPDAADALLESDLRLTGGRFRVAILNVCEQRGILPAGLHQPKITHRPLKDIEDVDQDREVVARIESELPLDLGRTMLIYEFTDWVRDTLQPERDQNDSTRYIWNIPASGEATTVNYYFVATDSSGVFSTLPVGPDEFQYRIGPDTTPPTIVSFDPIPDTVFPDGNIRVRCIVTDNLGVGRVTVFWAARMWEVTGSTELETTDDSSGVYTGRLSWYGGDLGQIAYFLEVIDRAANENRTFAKQGYFTVRQDALIEDFESDSPRWSLEGWNRSNGQAFRGDWSLRDRADSTVAPHEAVALFDETWAFDGMRHARLLFVERHLFDRRGAERGVVEVREEGSEEYREVAHFVGRSRDWTEQEINLDQYAADNSPPIQVRFRSITPPGAYQVEGWFIDNIRLQVGNIVDAPGLQPVQPMASFLGEPFPNPANSGVRFFVRTPRGGEVQLLELSGRTVLTLPVPSGAMVGEIDLSKLPSGVYYLKAPGGISNTAKRIVLVR